MLIEKKEEGFNREEIVRKQEKDKPKVKETWKDLSEFAKIVLGGRQQSKTERNR